MFFKPRAWGTARRGPQAVGMTTKADFTEEEWARLERSPIVAAMAISLADPGGPIEAVKESMAGIKTVTEAAQSDRSAGAGARSREELPARSRARGRTRWGASSPRARWPARRSWTSCARSTRIVTQKATPEEAAAFREWLLASAKRAAEAAKEGGFMGFKAERVSEGEQEMLDKLAEVPLRLARSPHSNFPLRIPATLMAAGARSPTAHSHVQHAAEQHQRQQDEPAQHERPPRSGAAAGNRGLTGAATNVTPHRDRA